jgi:hypothetical protein
MKRLELKLVVLIVLAVLGFLWLVKDAPEIRKKKAGQETRPSLYEEYSDE